jgi:hypothetical protein
MHGIFALVMQAHNCGSWQNDFVLGFQHVDLLVQMVFADAFICGDGQQFVKEKTLIIVDLALLVGKLVIRLEASDAPRDSARHYLERFFALLTKMCCTQILLRNHTFY